MDPLSNEVWICLLIVIPVYIGIIISMNYAFNGSTNWEASASSIVRSVLSERKRRSPPKHLYQKLLILVWSWMMVVLICAYKGNLLAMITKPIIKTPFKNAEELVEQTHVRWGVGKDDIISSYGESFSMGTTMRKIIDKAISCADALCTVEMKHNKQIAAIFDASKARYVISNDMRKTGTCNYYLTQDRILSSGYVLAFQVSNFLLTLKEVLNM